MSSFDRNNSYDVPSPDGAVHETCNTSRERLKQPPDSDEENDTDFVESTDNGVAGDSAPRSSSAAGNKHTVADAIKKFNASKGDLMVTFPSKKKDMRTQLCFYADVLYHVRASSHSGLDFSSLAEHGPTLLVSHSCLPCCTELEHLVWLYSSEIGSIPLPLTTAIVALRKVICVAAGLCVRTLIARECVGDHPCGDAGKIVVSCHKSRASGSHKESDVDHFNKINDVRDAESLLCALHAVYRNSRCLGTMYFYQSAIATMKAFKDVEPETLPLSNRRPRPDTFADSDDGDDALGTKNDADELGAKKARRGAAGGSPPPCPLGSAAGNPTVPDTSERCVVPSDSLLRVAERGGASSGSGGGAVGGDVSWLELVVKVVSVDSRHLYTSLVMSDITSADSRDDGDLCIDKAFWRTLVAHHGNPQHSLLWRCLSVSPDAQWGRMRGFERNAKVFVTNVALLQDGSSACLILDIIRGRASDADACDSGSLGPRLRLIADVLGGDLSPEWQHVAFLLASLLCVPNPAHHTARPDGTSVRSFIFDDRVSTNTVALACVQQLVCPLFVKDGALYKHPNPFFVVAEFLLGCNGCDRDTSDVNTIISLLS